MILSMGGIVISNVLLLIVSGDDLDIRFERSGRVSHHGLRYRLNVLALPIGGGAETLMAGGQKRVGY
jgi:hypothetical protein